MAAESIVSSVAQVGTVVDNIVNSGDKVKIAEYQAQGEVAKANALIAQAQAKAEAEAQAQAKTRNTYIAVGVFLVVAIAGTILILKRKPVAKMAIQAPLMPKPLLPVSSPSPS